MKKLNTGPEQYRYRHASMITCLPFASTTALSLLELLAATTIMCLIAAIAVRDFNAYYRETLTQALYSYHMELIKAAIAYMEENGTQGISLGRISVGGLSFLCRPDNDAATTVSSPTTTDVGCSKVIVTTSSGTTAYAAPGYYYNDIISTHPAYPQFNATWLIVFRKYTTPTGVTPAAVPTVTVMMVDGTTDSAGKVLNPTNGSTGSTASAWKSPILSKINYNGPLCSSAPCPTTSANESANKFLTFSYMINGVWNTSCVGYKTPGCNNIPLYNSANGSTYNCLSAFLPYQPGVNAGGGFYSALSTSAKFMIFPQSAVLPQSAGAKSICGIDQN